MKKVESFCINIKEEIINKYSYLIKTFFTLVIIFIIAIYPIIRANFNYLDDLGRVIIGYKRVEKL